MYPCFDLTQDSRMPQLQEPPLEKLANRWGPQGGEACAVPPFLRIPCGAVTFALGILPPRNEGYQHLFSIEYRDRCGIAGKILCNDEIFDLAMTFRLK